MSWDIANMNRAGHFISTRLQGESPFLVCCWRLTHLTLHHVHLIPLYPNWLWWRIKSTSEWTCHLFFPNCQNALLSPGWLCPAGARAPSSSCGGSPEECSTKAGCQRRSLISTQNVIVDILVLESMYYIFLSLQVLFTNLRNISEIYGVPTSGQD